MQAAVDERIKRKPHLAARRTNGNVGQGARAEPEQIGLAAVLRRMTGAVRPTGASSAGVDGEHQREAPSQELEATRT